MCTRGQSSCFVSFANFDLIKLDINTCDTVYIGDMGLMMTDIALTPSGNLYGVDYTALYRIDTTNASCTSVFQLPNMPMINSLMALDDNHLLSIDYAGELKKITISTGGFESLGNVGYIPSGDITYLNGFFYFSAIQQNQLIRLKLSPGFDQLETVEVVGSMNTQTNMVYGVLNSSPASDLCSENEPYLFAFEQGRVYGVNTETAYCTLVCDSINFAYANGAASLSEIPKNNIDIQTKMPNVFTPNHDQINDRFEPVLCENCVKCILSVYNRWGNKIYEQAGEQCSWDGYTDWNVYASDGIYFYIFTAWNACGAKQEVKGTLTLAK